MKRTGVLLAAALVWPAIGSAHDSTGRNGGRVTDAGRYHIELVVKADKVDVFISDADDKPVPAQGFKGTAIFVIDGKSQRIVLEPADGSRLSGTGPLPTAAAKGSGADRRPGRKNRSRAIQLTGMHGGGCAVRRQRYVTKSPRAAPWRRALAPWALRWPAARAVGRAADGRRIARQPIGPGWTEQRLLSRCPG